MSRETQRGGERGRERGHFGWIIVGWRVLGGWETCRGKKLLIEVGERRRGRRHDDTEREIVRCGWVFLSFFDVREEMTALLLLLAADGPIDR